MSRYLLMVGCGLGLFTFLGINLYGMIAPPEPRPWSSIVWAGGLALFFVCLFPLLNHRSSS